MKKLGTRFLYLVYYLTYKGSQYFLLTTTSLNYFLSVKLRLIFLHKSVKLSVPSFDL